MTKFITGFIAGALVATLGVTGTIKYVDQLINTAKDHIPAPAVSNSK